MEQKFEVNAEDLELESATFQESTRRSQALWEDLPRNPAKYRVLTGERPTGPLHIGHLFGTVANRVRIQDLGATTFIVIADYQVLTDRDTAEAVATNVHEALLDYLAAGLDPENGRTFFFSHSHVPELNQLLLPFLSLVTTAELDRNPTVKEEIQAAGLRQVNALMYTYPIHQAADILFCKGNVVPVGRDQLPHLELTRRIARRFNERFTPDAPVFPVPEALLSDFPLVLGTDGQKMSKSRGNAIMLKMTPEETARAIKGAKRSENLCADEVSSRVAAPSTAAQLRATSSTISWMGGRSLRLWNTTRSMWTVYVESGMGRSTLPSRTRLSSAAITWSASSAAIRPPLRCFDPEARNVNRSTRRSLTSLTEVPSRYPSVFPAPSA